MPSIGPLELVIVLIIALVIFGPKRLPDLGRSLGNGIREFRSSVSGEKREDDGPVEIEDGVGVEEDQHDTEPAGQRSG